NGVEPQALCVRPEAHAYQDTVAAEGLFLRAFCDLHHYAAFTDLDALDASTRAQFDALASESALEGAAHIFVFVGQDAVQELDDRAVAPNRAPEVGEFDADRPPADDDHRPRHLAQVEGLPARHHPVAVDRNTRDGPTHATRRQDQVLRRDG